MRKITTLAALALTLSLGCSPADPNDPSNPNNPTPPGANGYRLPERLQVVTAREEIGQSGSRAVTPGSYSAPGTDYSNYEASIRTYNEALDPLNQVNMILCFISQMKPEQMIDKGVYVALVDDKACGGGGGESSGKRYVRMVIDVNETKEGAVVDAWSTEVDREFNLQVHVLIKDGVSASNPYGNFVLRWAMLDRTTGKPAGEGELATVATSDGGQGFTLYDKSQRDGGSFISAGSVVVDQTTDSGNARTLISASGFRDFGAAFDVVFNKELAHVERAGTVAELAGKGTTCNSRTSFVEHAWRYGVYATEGGAEVKLMGGFPVRYGKDFARYGWVNAQGAWGDGEAIPADSKLRRDSTDDRTSVYTLTVVPGVLTKNVVSDANYASVVGAECNYWDKAAQQAGYDSWVVILEAQQIKVVAGVKRDYNGDQRIDLSPPRTLSLNNGDFVQLMCGAEREIWYRFGETAVKIVKRQLVNGGEAEFKAGPLKLVCADYNCPKSGITATDLQTQDGPFLTPTRNLQEVYHYTFNAKGTDAMLLVYNGQRVTYPTGDRGTFSNTPHAQGIRSGWLLPESALATAKSVDDLRGDQVAVYYTWETGLDDWQQLRRIVDADGNVVTFDRPIQASYVHSKDNERLGGDGRYDGRQFALAYQGEGQLDGLPWKSEDNNGHNFPEITLKDGVAFDDSHVVKAWDVERELASVGLDKCQGLKLGPPDVAVPEKVSSSIEVKPMPKTDASPAFIGGEAQ
ncbi:MAG: hypothetical protein H6707_14825 [Deltaproteobacteria bacterium]|nr:hypothetical protein [Deltaproteobacteria bacterium]